MAKSTLPTTEKFKERINYGKVKDVLPLPNLIGVQINSFKWLLKDGLREVFEEIYPIENANGSLELQFVDYEFGEPTYSIDDCKEQFLTYSMPLRATFRLINKLTGEIKESKIFMGDFPIMTDSGTFVINGGERVIISQLVRSPGAYFSQVMDVNKGKMTYGGEIIPTRGTWIEFETDGNDLINVRIDRTKKLPATVLLKAIGIEQNEVLIDLFGDDYRLINTLEKDSTASTKEAMIEIYNKLRPGEPATEEGSKILLIQRFFDRKRYDLAKAGRYKLNRKLNVYERLLDKIIAEHLVDADGEIVYKKGTFIDKEKLDYLRSIKFFENGAHKVTLDLNTDLDDDCNVQIVKVYTSEDQDRIMNIIGTDMSITKKYVTMSDIVATFSFTMNMLEGFGVNDDIDHLSNRRVKPVGELIQNQFKIGLSRMERSVKEKMSISDTTGMTPQNISNVRPLTAAIKEFFSSSQLSQYADQVNPLSELSHKRRISALGAGGLTRERAGAVVRDVHVTHYGRICPVETPEGGNIGLINNLANYAIIDEYGFIKTPYRKVDKETGKLTDECIYMSADDEYEYYIAEANIKLDAEGRIAEDRVVARHKGENIEASKEDIDFVGVSSKQIISVAASCIPFLENDDGQRALMGANMQKQAIPLLRPDSPIVGTGMEKYVAHDSGVCVLAKEDGTVKYVDGNRIEVEGKKGTEVYRLHKFQRSNQGTAIVQHPIVEVGQKVKAGEIIADGPATQNGEMALGQNVVVAFMTWNGYNFEDAVIMSDRVIKDDVYTSLHIESYDVECRDTKLGHEEITRDIPNVGEDSKVQLDSRGIVVPGFDVRDGDILVGKITPKGQTEPSPDEKLLMAIFGEKTKEGKDTSLRVPHGGAGTVVDVKVFSRKQGHEMAPGVNEVIRVYIAQKRKIQEGDKMAGRHGNKGVISKILPQEDMPFLEDGTPVDIMLNPLGVPSRMNIGQILEFHLGMAGKRLGVKFATPVFEGVTNDELVKLMAESGMAPDGKEVLRDGRTGERFDARVAVGVMYMIKLNHMVDDKLHARAIGPYSMVTQQPLGGKAQNGGQRVGEMEVWACEAYGAAHLLQEIMTIKSDDMIGRAKTYEAIIKGKPLPTPGVPESFRVMVKELQGLAIDVKLYDVDGELIDNKAASKAIEKEETELVTTLKDEMNKYEDFQYEKFESFEDEE
ncbi:MAG: DNA-directed RNA polymerase subunit beta [Erysipelotrichaceae bacterium]|nr:DNA-directed RNA polymerase subunit beta [Erysipelotrichaceae bacterium]